MTSSPLANLAQQERTRHEILHKSEVIPPLPDIVVRALTLLNEGETEPVDLEDLLRYDQVLVARLLGMVNSPFYGLARRITSIRDAIMVLGFRGLRSLLLASSTAKYMRRDFSCYGHDDKGLWLHALSVGSAARSLAKQVRLVPAMWEELFVAGLLHDIGKMLVAPYLVSAAVRVSDPAEERLRLGLDHAEVGALVAAKWKLTPMVQEILRQHHGHETPPEHAVPIAVVRLADVLAHEAGTGYFSGRVPAVRALPCDLQALGLTEETWQASHATAIEAMHAAVASMSRITS